MPNAAKPAPSSAVTILPPDDSEALVPLRYRFDGWTAPKQRAFLAALGTTGCIRDACRAVGMSKTSAYRLRERSAEFAGEWDCALAMAATVLEQVAFQRAVVGVKREIWRYGKLVGTETVYSDSLLRLLIVRGDLRAGVHKTPAELVEAAREAARRAGGTFETRARSEDVTNDILRRLAAMKRGALRKDALRAERLLEAGLVP